MQEVVLRASILASVALALALPASAQPRPRAQQGEQLGQLDSSETLFTVMAALTAGGYNQEAESPTNHPIRKAVRDYFAPQTAPVIDAMRRYVRDHRPRNGNELSAYISYALLVKGAPNFDWKEPNLPLPPDVAALEDFTPLLAQFYRDAQIANLWKQARPSYEEEIARYHEAVTQAVIQSNSYLRVPLDSNQKGRNFQIQIDLLGAPNQIHTRAFLYDDTVVVTRHTDLPIAEIRHAYLVNLVDPLSLRHAADLKKKAALIDYAQGSPILAEHYKTDFGLLATESLVRAIEAKLDRRPAYVDQSLREGFVVTPAFYELLGVYEKQEQAMRLYFAEFVAGIDLRKEERRLDRIDFVSERAVKSNRVTRVVEDKPLLTGAAKTLEEGEDLLRQRKPAEAKTVFLKVIEQTAEKPVQAKGYYGLARVAILERDPETGDRLFRRLLELDPDGATKSWALLYLGKLADSQGEQDEAEQQYKAALATPDVPDQVKREAEQGLKGAFARKVQ